MSKDGVVARYLQSLREHANDKIVRQEVLSQPDNSNKLLKHQEFYELRIQHSTDPSQSGYEVIQWRTCWSETDERFLREDELQERWSTVQQAWNRYAARLRSLNDLGFKHSDLDF